MDEKKSSMGIDPEILESLRAMKNNMPAMSEFMAMQARLHKQKYDALVDEGFTETQALELCKSISITE